MKNDKQFWLEEIESVQDATDGWYLGFGGLGLFVTSETEKTPPRVGECLRLYGRGIGYDVRGIVAGGRVYRYQSPEARKAYLQKKLRRFA